MVNTTKPIAAALAAVAFAGAFLYGHHVGGQAARLSLEQAHNEALQAAAQEQARLQEFADNQRKAYVNEKAAIAREHQRTLDRLRVRFETRLDPDRPVSEAAALGAGCTGAGLAGPDARFLAGYAADAAYLKVALDECRAKYAAISKTK
jgi:hypothetical protein